MGQEHVVRDGYVPRKTQLAIRLTPGNLETQLVKVVCKFLSRPIGWEHYAEVNVSRLREVIAITLHTAQHDAILIVRKITQHTVSS